MANDVDNKMLRFIATEYREQVKGNESIDSDLQKEHEERFYELVNSEEYGELQEFVVEIEDEHDIKMQEVRKFCETLRGGNIVEEDSGPKLQHTMSEGTTQAIRLRAQSSDADEMMLYSDDPLSVPAIFETQKEIYRDFGKLTFTIPAQNEWRGRISVEVAEHKQKIELLRVYESEDQELSFNHFGESATKHKGKKVKDRLTKGFFAYKFVSEHQEFLLFSEERLDPMTCTVKGAHFEISDYKEVGDNAGLPSNLDIIFAHSVEPAIQTMPRDEVQKYFGDVDHDWFASHLLGEFRHPEWFEKMVMATLAVHEDFGYPSGLLWLADTGTGKTMFQESITRALKEQSGIHTGSGGTLKGLIPSFKESPPQEGHLLKCERVAAVDEIFNFLSGAATGKQSKRDVFRPMLDLIEHRQRTFNSGNGSIRGKMEGVMIGTGNPSYGIDNIMQAAEQLDQAFLGRFILYEQTESHIQFVEEQKYESDKTEEEMYPVPDNDFISLYDFFRKSLRVEVDHSRIREIKERLRDRVPSTFDAIYRSRYDHHIRNVVAGIAKINSIIEDRDDFEVRDSDYEEAEHIFQIIVNSWSQRKDIEAMDLPVRPYFLPNELRKIYEQIKTDPGMPADEIETDADSLSFALSELKKYDVIEKVEGKFYPYFHEEVKNQKVKGLVE